MSLFLKQSVSFAEAISNLNELPILVLGHRRPDGDCIGSQVALTRISYLWEKTPGRLMKIPFPDPAKVCGRHTVLFSETSGGGRISGHYGRLCRSPPGGRYFEQTISQG